MAQRWQERICVALLHTVDQLIPVPAKSLSAGGDGGVWPEAAAGHSGGGPLRGLQQDFMLDAILLCPLVAGSPGFGQGVYPAAGGATVCPDAGAAAGAGHEAEAVDCSHLRRGGGSLKPRRRAPRMLVGHRPPSPIRWERARVRG